MAIQKALETLCYVDGCGSVAIESAQIHVETGGAVARQLLDSPSLYNNKFPPRLPLVAGRAAHFLNTVEYIAPPVEYNLGLMSPI